MSPFYSHTFCPQSELLESWKIFSHAFSCNSGIFFFRSTHFAAPQVRWRHLQIHYCTRGQIYGKTFPQWHCTYVLYRCFICFSPLPAPRHFVLQNGMGEIHWSWGRVSGEIPERKKTTQKRELGTTIKTSWTGRTFTKWEHCDALRGSSQAKNDRILCASEKKIASYRAFWTGERAAGRVTRKVGKATQWQRGRAGKCGSAQCCTFPTQSHSDSHTPSSPLSCW